MWSSGGKRSSLRTRLIATCTISVFLEPNLSRSFLSFWETIHWGQFRLVLFVAPAHRYIHLDGNIFSSSWMLNTGAGAEWPGQQGNSRHTIMRGGITQPMNSDEWRWTKVLPWASVGCKDILTQPMSLASDVLNHCWIKPRQGHSLILKGILHIVGLKLGISNFKNAAVRIQIQPTGWKVNRYVIAMLIYGSKKPNATYNEKK